MKIKLVWSVLLLLSLTGCNDNSSENSDGEVTSSTSLNAASSRIFVQTKKVETIDLTSSVQVSDNSPVELDRVESLSLNSECIPYEVSGMVFTVRSSEPGQCVYEYTVKSGTSYTEGISQVGFSETGSEIGGTEATSSLDPVVKTGGIEDVIIVDLVADLPTTTPFPTGYYIDSSNVILLGNGEVTDITDTTFTYSSSISGITRIMYVLINNITDDVMLGSVDIAISQDVNHQPYAMSYKFSESYNEGQYIPSVDVDSLGLIGDADPEDDSNLQLVHVESMDDVLVSINPPAAGSINSTSFSFKPLTSGTKTVSYVISDHNGGYAIGLITFNAYSKYSDIETKLLDTDRLLTAPLTLSQVIDARLNFIGPDSEFDDIPFFSWDVANAYCVAYGGELPTAEQLEDLVNQPEWTASDWPKGMKFWTKTVSDSNRVAVKIDASITSRVAEPITNPNHLTCIDFNPIALRINTVGEPLHDKLQLILGLDQQLFVEALGVDGNWTNYIKPVTWESSHTNVADFIKGFTGLLSTISSGDTTVIVTSLTQQIPITVSLPVEVIHTIISDIIGWPLGETFQQIVSQPGNIIRFKAGCVIDAISGGSDQPWVGNPKGGTLQTVSLINVSKVDYTIGYFYGSARDQVAQLVFHYSDGREISIGTPRNTGGCLVNHMERGSFDVTKSILGFNSWTTGDEGKGYLSGLQFLYK